MRNGAVDQVLDGERGVAVVVVLGKRGVRGVGLVGLIGLMDVAFAGLEVVAVVGSVVVTLAVESRRRTRCTRPRPRRPARPLVSTRLTAPLANVTMTPSAISRSMVKSLVPTTVAWMPAVVMTCSPTPIELCSAAVRLRAFFWLRLNR